MQCPECEDHLGWDWIEDECIEPNEGFDCPSCGVALRYIIDEGTYYGAQHKTVEVVDE
ncbi:hypothetical protein AB4561_13805 [Vibrio sp. 10N.222.55.A3]|uniref:hypothetical protein n=1 Tax=unclassified Vibrio TaxID=2614977 RepID=UPI001E2B2D23|nr:hypothetical protein [Vibrio sp. F13]MCC4891709.1 hypothetical protein [Vibrio sp. F13]